MKKLDKLQTKLQQCIFESECRAWMADATPGSELALPAKLSSAIFDNSVMMAENMLMQKYILLGEELKKKYQIAGNEEGVAPNAYKFTKTTRAHEEAVRGRTEKIKA